MTAQPRLLALATAVPPYLIGQEEAAQRARALFAESIPETIDHMLPVFGNAGIERRYSCVPIDWYAEPHGWRDRNTVYINNALDLLERAARKCLASAGLEPRDMDGIVAVSTTGIATPSLDALLIDRLALRPDIKRLPIFGLGCAGGVLGLARAAELARANPASRILFLVVELCALSFRKDDFSKSNLVATALFGDGAAAAIIASEGTGPAFGVSGEHTWPNSLDIMGWDVEEDGLRALFSRDIPTLIHQQLREVTTEFLARQGKRLADIDHFVCHPGGAKVVTALEEAFDLQEGTLMDARTILRDYGNMSAATVLFVLERMLQAGPKGRLLMTALGPGFTAAFQMLEIA